MTADSKTVVPADAKQPADRKPKSAKPKVKKITGGVEITLHGITVRLKNDDMGNPRTLDDLSIIQDAMEDAEAAGGDVDGVNQELQQEALAALPRVMRRLFGFSGFRAIHGALEREFEGEYSMEHVAQFLFEAMQAAAPN